MDRKEKNVTSERIVPCMENGMAQPVFPFTDGKTGPSYDAASSHIMRFCVYVETDYDTDGDGKRDRLKVFVQVPESAARGNYRAGTIFEACPYLAGVNTDVFRHLKEVEDMDLPEPDFSGILSAPACIPTGEISSLEAALRSDRTEWYYPDPGFEGAHCYDLESYRYFLVRGFAVVMAAGPGTLGSDGVVNCGSTYETNSFCAVIEWLRGERTAFSDRTGSTAVRADWSDGKVAMTGKSYAGTIPFAIASTGIEGLKTIIPVAGIADWYTDSNQQGAQRYYPKEMLLSMLSYFCSSRYHDPSLTEKQKERMDAFFCKLSADQIPTGFDYGPFWEERNYTRCTDNFRCSALIVHGLNDDNVSTKNFEMMYRCFQKAGRDVKLLLHQGGHITPCMENHGYGIRVDGGDYNDILNRWIVHYFYGAEDAAADHEAQAGRSETSGAGILPAVLVQSNLNQDTWLHVSSWETDHRILLCCGESGGLLPDYAGASFAGNAEDANSLDNANDANDANHTDDADNANGTDDANDADGLNDVDDTNDAVCTNDAYDANNANSASADRQKAVIDTDLEKAGMTAENFDEKMSLSSSNANFRYLTEVLKEDLTIKGTVKVSFTAELVRGEAGRRFDQVCLSDADKRTQLLGRREDRQDDVKLSLLLVDLSEEAFEQIKAGNASDGRDAVPVAVEQKGGLLLGGSLPPIDLNRFETARENYKVFSRGYIDLCNPGAGYEPETASVSIALEKGCPHVYNVFMNPTYYTVAAGHRLAVVIGTEDPVNCLFHKDYAAAISHASVQVDIPAE